MKKKQETKKWFSLLALGTILIVLYKTLDNFSNIFEWFRKLVAIIMPFIIGGLFAYIFYIPCKSIEETFRNSKVKILKKAARGLSVFTIYLIVFIAIFIIFNFILPPVTQSVKELATSLPEYYTRSMEYFSNLSENSVLKKLKIDEVVLNLQQINISNKIIELLSFENITGYIKGVFGAAGVIFDIFVVVVISIYLLLERCSIKKFLKSLSKALFSEEVDKKINKYYAKTNRIFFGFVSSQFADAIIVGIIVSIIMAIMKVKYAVLLGFMIGLFNIIPYLGAIVAVVISGIITIFTGGISKAIWLLIIITAVQQIDANIINPKILGSSLELSPIITIFSVTIFGAYFGILGMFLAVPIAAVIKVLLIDYIEERIKEKEIEKNYNKN